MSEVKRILAQITIAIEAISRNQTTTNEVVTQLIANQPTVNINNQKVALCEKPTAYKGKREAFKSFK